MGNKADVSGNDLLLAWRDDPRVRVIGLYLESFGNPRKFARVARSVSRSTPILALKSGRGASGRRAGLSHTAAAAAAEPVVDALFAQTGVQRVDSMEQLLDAARLIDHQPLPAGPRVAIVGNSGGPGIVAADAAEAAGLHVVELGARTRARLRAAAPELASDRNPVDLGAAVPADGVRSAVAAVLADPDVDAVVTVFTRTLTTPPELIRAAVVAAVRDAGPDNAVPVVATEVGAEPATVPVPGTGRALPVFAFPEPALGALAIAARCARAQRAPELPPATPEGMDVDLARRLVTEWLAAGAEWLVPAQAAQLLQALGIRVSEQRTARSGAAAVQAAGQLGYPVVLKLTRAVHKSDVGGVELDLRSTREVRCAMARLRQAARAAGVPAEVLVQPLHRGGVELIVGGVQDPQFGPVVLAGAGGVLTDLLRARRLGLAPLTEDDVQAMLDAPALAQLLDGFRGAPPVSRAALRDLVLRVGWLVDRVPQVAELDLNPVICDGARLVVVDAKVRVAPAAPGTDPNSRLLSVPLRPA